MRQSTITTSTALAICLFVLAACGQMGPLYQPGNESGASGASTEHEQVEEKVEEENAEPETAQEQPKPTSGTQDQ